MNVVEGGRELSKGGSYTILEIAIIP